MMKPIPGQRMKALEDPNLSPEQKQLLNQIQGIRYVVINTDFGGFGLSDLATDLYKEQSGIVDEDFWDRDIARDDPVLVQIVKELGEKSHGKFAQLKIVEIPADVDWEISEYDGREWVAEKHRTWS
jgi:hypothetical protein